MDLEIRIGGSGDGCWESVFFEDEGGSGMLGEVGLALSVCDDGVRRKRMGGWRIYLSYCSGLDIFARAQLAPQDSRPN